jgi:1-phosphatidylinositol-4-phosphate 5-kinase
VYRLKIYGNCLNFFVMNNLFYNTYGLTMNEKYDIKGSWVARNAKPPIEGMTLTCSYCEQKFVYRKRKKPSHFSLKSARSNQSAEQSHGIK